MTESTVARRDRGRIADPPWDSRMRVGSFEVSGFIAKWRERDMRLPSMVREIRN